MGNSRSNWGFLTCRFFLFCLLRKLSFLTTVSLRMVPGHCPKTHIWLNGIFLLGNTVCWKNHSLKPHNWTSGFWWLWACPEGRTVPVWKMTSGFPSPHRTERQRLCLACFSSRLVLVSALSWYLLLFLWISESFLYFSVWDKVHIFLFVCFLFRSFPSPALTEESSSLLSYLEAGFLKKLIQLYKSLSNYTKQ